MNTKPPAPGAQPWRADEIDAARGDVPTFRIEADERRVAEQVDLPPLQARALVVERHQRALGRQALEEAAMRAVHGALAPVGQEHVAQPGAQNGGVRRVAVRKTLPLGVGGICCIHARCNPACDDRSRE
ncbi:MAG: hypothetical protein M5U07_25065 [Xanthobacteraceae bacterium]|nr:hypothetical protein [Xanthobacteraceae bacterium]